MNTAVVWIAFPVVLAIAAFFLRRWQRGIAFSMAGVAFILAAGAWIAPYGDLIVLGPWSFTFSESFVFAGRQFVLGISDRATLGFVYLLLSFFFLGSAFARVSPLFVPLGLAMTVMLVASLAVEPFLYAALFIQVAVLIGVPLLSPPGIQVDRGVLRYLTFLSFALPFLLFSGWMLSGIDVEIAHPSELLPGLVFLGFGFAFLLAIFPLNSWIPMLTERTQPYSATFVIIILPVVAIPLLQQFLESFPWLLNINGITLLGLLVIVTGGLWAAFQRDLGRLLGYAAVIETGRSIIAISLVGGAAIYSEMLFSRMLAFGVWALALSLVRNRSGDLKFRTVQGIGRTIPLVALGVIAGNFSIAGFPLLAGFPVQMIFLGQLTQSSPAFALWGLMGSFGLLIGGIRTLAVFVMGPEEPSPPIKIDLSAQLLIVLGLLALVLLGLFPHWFIGIFPG